MGLHPYLKRESLVLDPKPLRRLRCGKEPKPPKAKILTPAQHTVGPGGVDDLVNLRLCCLSAISRLYVRLKIKKNEGFGLTWETLAHTFAEAMWTLDPKPLAVSKACGGRASHCLPSCGGLLAAECAGVVPNTFLGHSQDCKQCVSTTLKKKKGFLSFGPHKHPCRQRPSNSWQ